MAVEKFATSISCMDGRIQIPLNNWIKKNYLVDYVDTITEPGVERKITENVGVEQIKSKAQISVFKHNSDLIVVSGHYGCAGNPVSNEDHIKQIRISMETINSWKFPVKVVGAWINDQWEVEQIQ